MTCQPSSLISAIHRNLPYFTSNPFEGVNLTNATFTVENILDDVVVMQPIIASLIDLAGFIIIFTRLFLFQRAGAWSGIILAILLLFMIATCTYCCIACCFCCRGNKKPAAVKVLLGIVTSVIVVIGM